MRGDHLRVHLRIRRRRTYTREFVWVPVCGTVGSSSWYRDVRAAARKIPRATAVRVTCKKCHTYISKQCKFKDAHSDEPFCEGCGWKAVFKKKKKKGDGDARTISYGHRGTGGEATGRRHEAR